MCLAADEPGTYLYTGVSHSFLPVLNRRYLVFIVARPARTCRITRVSFPRHPPEERAAENGWGLTKGRLRRLCE